MKEVIDEIARKLQTALKNTFDDFEGLYLFGSQVTGKAVPDSDIDVVAVIDASNKEKRWAIWDIILQLEYDYDIAIDIHPMTRNELERNYIFHDQVVNKGIFYGAS
jgi:predicted nucleotidyltransferase